MKALDEKGIIHRDLKPQNILLNREEQNRLRVKIGKFPAYTYNRFFFAGLTTHNQSSFKLILVLPVIWELLIWQRPFVALQCIWLLKYS